MGWLTAGGILGLLLILLLCRIRVEFSYRTIMTLDIRYLFLHVRLLPGKAEEKHGKGKKNSSKRSSQKKRRKNTTSVKRREKRRAAKTIDADFDELMEKTSDFMAILRNLFYGVNILLRHIVIDRVCVSMRIGGEDPAQAGINYGKTCVIVYTLLATLQNYLNIKVQKLQLVPEMFEDVFETKVSLRVCIPVYVTLWAALSALWKILVRIIKKQLAAVKSETNSTQGV